MARRHARVLSLIHILGRGYVLRRLLRRTVRSMRMLGVTDPVLPTLFPTSKAAMEASYPELNDTFHEAVSYTHLDVYKRQVRMREKQRLRAQYGISEKQLRAAYEKATRTAGQTGNAMLTDLETRLDNLVLRAGFARTTAQARQFVVHRHILVDGNIVDRPSYRVKPGQTIQVKAKSQTMVPFQIAAEGVHRDVLPAVPGYLDVNLPSLKATVTRKPEVEEIPVQVNIQYVVEFYAR